jgi:hypothetical protein
VDTSETIRVPLVESVFFSARTETAWNPASFQSIEYIRETGGGNASQRGSLDKISPSKSPIISPDLESGMPSNRSPIIVRGTAKKWQVSHRHRSPDYALIRETSPESLPDRRSSHQKSGVLFKHFAWHECLKRDLGREFGRPTRLSLSTALKRDSQKWAVLF